MHSLLWEEAQLIGGVDPDFHRRDLADAIESGALPEWDLGVQVFSDTADQLFEGIDLLDPTKIVPEELAPVQILGTMTLTANPTNYFAELGGPNFSQIPVNRPHADVNEMYRDGMHQSAVHEGVAPYKPNSLDGRLPTVATAEEGALVDPAVQMDGYAVRTASQTFSDHFSQPRMFYRSLSRVEQDHTVDAYIFELSKCERTGIRQRVVDVLAGVDGALARWVADGLGLVPRSPETTESSLVSPALSQVLGSWPVDGRKVGILVSDDSDPTEIAGTVEAVKGVGVVPLVTAVTGAPTADDGEHSLIPDKLYRSARSVEFDAIIIDSLPAEDNVAEIRVLLAEVVRHLKPVAVSDRALGAVHRLGLDTDIAGVLTVEESSRAVTDISEALTGHRVLHRS